MSDRHTYYGAPNEPLEDITHADDLRVRPNGPEVGDELCYGHQMHYEWNGTDWGCGPLNRPIIGGNR